MLKNDGNFWTTWLKIIKAFQKLFTENLHNKLQDHAFMGDIGPYYQLT